MFWARSYNGIWWLRQDTTNISRALLDHDIPVVSPWGSPRVLNNPCLRCITNYSNTMVKFCSTALWKNTTSVMLKGWLISFNGNRDNTFINCSLELGYGVSRDILIVWNLEYSLVTRGLTLSISCSVLVIILKVHHMGLSIFKSIVHQSTMASIITIWFRTVH